MFLHHSHVLVFFDLLLLLAGQRTAFLDASWPQYRILLVLHMMRFVCGRDGSDSSLLLLLRLASLAFTIHVYLLQLVRIHRAQQCRPDLLRIHPHH